jgi:DNA-binding NtrC family response regulator
MSEKYILVIDDEDDVLELLKELIEKMGYNALTASNAQEALDILDNTKVDVIISDLLMPEMDGIELLKRVKARKGDIPFLVITGHPTVETAVDAIKKGAYDYLPKPFQMQDVAIKINRAVEKKGMGERLRWSKGLVMALLLSIPLWLVLGIIFASLLK